MPLKKPQKPAALNGNPFIFDTVDRSDWWITWSWVGGVPQLVVSLPVFEKAIHQSMPLEFYAVFNPLVMGALRTSASHSNQMFNRWSNCPFNRESQFDDMWMNWKFATFTGKIRPGPMLLVSLPVASASDLFPVYLPRKFDRYSLPLEYFLCQRIPIENWEEREAGDIFVPRIKANQSIFHFSIAFHGKPFQATFLSSNFLTSWPNSYVFGVKFWPEIDLL